MSSMFAHICTSTCFNSGHISASCLKLHIGVRRSLPRERLADMSKEGIDVESPEYKAVFDTLKPDIHHITASGDSDRALATAKQASGNDNDGPFEGVVRLNFIGRYAILGPRTPDSQQWCVD